MLQLADFLYFLTRETHVCPTTQSYLSKPVSQ